MIIKDIKYTESGNYIKISAICKIRHFTVDEIYFLFDKKYKDFLTVDASPFAACLLLPAMQRGETLIIESSISEKLYKGMHQIMQTFLDWNLGLKPIEIRAKKIVKDSYNPTSNASFFSGGVDSFYTYLKHKKDDNPINYFILINGYDIQLENNELWEATSKTVEEIAQKEGIEVIKVESNVYNLIDPIIAWDNLSGACLSAVALCLRRKLKNVYLPSSYTSDQLFPAGSHPAIDKFWSTETLSIIHDGLEASRLDKVTAIAKYPIVLNYLRVCYLNLKGKYNCGVCDKCQRTMVSLYIVGVLDKAKTFPNTLDLNVIKKMKIKTEFSAIFQRENLDALEKSAKHKSLQDALKESLQHVPPGKTTTHKSFSRKILSFDHIYTRGLARKLVRLTK